MYLKEDFSSNATIIYKIWSVKNGFKRVVAGIAALVISMSMVSFSAIADEYDVGSDTSASTGSDLDINYHLIEEYGAYAEESDNYMLKELLAELADEIEEETGISPQWSAAGGTSSDHAILAKAAYAANVDDIEGDKKTVKQALVYGAYKADCSELHNSKENIVQLHGIKNYEVHLKVLWKYAKLVKYDDVDTRILNSMTNLTNSEKINVNKLLETIPKIFDLYQEECKEGKEVTLLEKKYLVIGLALHNIGDTYAHRALVPMYYSYPENISVYFDIKHFGSFTDLARAIASRELFTTAIVDYMVSPYNKRTPTNKPNRYYEDNTDFMPERYTASKNTSITFLDQINIKGNNFSTDYYDVSEVELYNFEKFSNSL